MNFEFTDYVSRTGQDYHYDGLAMAVSAIAHGGDNKGGTIVPFRRESFDVDGRVREIPVVSGNAFRGILRDKGVIFMLKTLGYDEETAIKLSVPAAHFLSSGGALSKDAGRGIDIGEQRRLREMIPLAGVFAGATGRNIMPGKLAVGKWYPLCRELKAYIPKQYHDHPHIRESIFDRLEIQNYSRKDDLKDYRWHQYLEAPQEELLLAPKVHTNKQGEEIADKPGTAQQMRYGFEVLSAGTTFWTWMHLYDATDLEFEGFMSALYEWSKLPLIGGQHRHGCGLISFAYDGWMSVSPLAQLSRDAVALPRGQAYTEHLHTRKRDILSVLKDIG